LVVNTAQLAKVEMILRAGASLDVVDSNGDTPLHDACVFQYSWAHTNRRHIDARVNVAKFLVYQGASTNAQNNIGDTPLHIACKNMFHSRSGNAEDIEVSRFHLEISCFIVECSLDDSLSIKNCAGKTPLEVLGQQLLKVRYWGEGFQINNDLMTSTIDKIVEHIPSLHPLK